MEFLASSRQWQNNAHWIWKSNMSWSVTLGCDTCICSARGHWSSWERMECLPTFPTSSHVLGQLSSACSWLTSSLCSVLCPVLSAPEKCYPQTWLCTEMAKVCPIGNKVQVIYPLLTAMDKDFPSLSFHIFEAKGSPEARVWRIQSVSQLRAEVTGFSPL